MVRTLLSTSLFVLLAACGGGGSEASASPEPAAQQPAASVPADPYKGLVLGRFTNAGPILDGTYAVESQLLLEPGGYSLFHQCDSNKICRISRADQSTATTSAPLLPNVCRFPYLFDYSGTHYLVCGLTHGGSYPYLFSSPDLVNWTMANGGNPLVIGGMWEPVFNVAILPIGNRWHMLAEVGIAGSSAIGGLAYSYADFSPSMDFTAHQTPLVIPGGGSPDLFLKGGKMVAVHGMAHDGYFNSSWYVTMSEADPTNPTAWTTRRDKLLIGEPGIDVADPSYIEFNGSGVLSLSYDQRQILVLRGPTL